MYRKLRCWVSSSGKYYGYIALSALIVCLCVAIVDWPTPVISDEFSYILGADTFRHARLTNQINPPDLEISLESMHILVNPTYMSKYPPLQSIILAFGWKIGGTPVIGIWVGYIGASLALMWMMKVWFPQRIAALGAMMFVLNGVLIVMWAGTFWGGAITVAVAAIAIGSVGNIVKHERTNNAWLLGIAFAALMLNRPYEGGIFASNLATWVFFDGHRKRKPKRIWLIAMKAGVPVICAIIWSMYYNYRITGDWGTLPYMLHQKNYTRVPLLCFLPLSENVVEWNHAVLERYERDFALQTYEALQSCNGFIRSLYGRICLLFGGGFSVGYAFIVVCAMNLNGSFWGRLEKYKWPLSFTLISGGIALVVETYSQYHYAAPLLPVVLLILTANMEMLWKVKEKRLLMALLIIMGLSQQAVHGVSLKRHRDRSSLKLRPQIVEKLETFAGKHVVFVHYEVTHDLQEEWVYNDADIERARVVWLRETKKSRDQEVLGYFNDRTAWNFNADTMELKQAIE